MNQISFLSGSFCFVHKMCDRIVNHFNVRSSPWTYRRVNPVSDFFKNSSDVIRQTSAISDLLQSFIYCAKPPIPDIFRDTISQIADELQTTPILRLITPRNDIVSMFPSFDTSLADSRVLADPCIVIISLNA